MPIREFECPDQHLTEKILHGEDDQKIMVVECEQQLAHPDSPSTQYFCGKPATRLQIPTRTGTPQFVAGCGGFYKATK